MTVMLRACVLLILYLSLSPCRALAQVNPDSSGTGGKLIISAPVDSPVTDTMAGKGKLLTQPADSGGGKLALDPGKKPKGEKAEKEKEPKIERAVNRPRVAFQRSLVLPGWGQVYNKSAWKVPIIYGGFGAFGYFFYTNHKNYLLFKHAYLCRTGVDTTFCPVPVEYDYYEDENLKEARDFYRRYRDLNVILGALWYTLNVVDAFVEAHLDGFTVSDDITMRIGPAMPQNGQFGGTSLGLGITFTFK